MLSRTFFYAMTMATMTVVVVVANTVAEATDDRVRFHGSGQLSEVYDLDKTGTTGGRENNNGPQVLYSKALASRVSLKAERTGTEHLPKTRGKRGFPSKVAQNAAHSMQKRPLFPSTCGLL